NVIAFRIRIGEISKTPAKMTLAASIARRGQLARANKRIAAAQKNTSNIAFARSQHDRPTRAPAPMAQAILCRFTVSRNIHVADRTIQLVGASASGNEP